MSSQSFPIEAQRLTYGDSMRWASVVVSMLGLLAACGDGKRPATQVVAKVNKEEISVHQVNYVLQRMSGVTAQTSDAASREIIERLISQELAVQKAQELRLDRNPRTVQALEAARRDVLARAYIQSLSEGVPKPTPEEVSAFYLEKPALFRERKVYTFQEVTFTGLPAQMAQVQSKLTESKSIAEFADYLRGSGLKFSAKFLTQPAENLPLEMLDRISALAPGQALFLPQAGGAKALILASFNPEPVTQLDAAPAIEMFLLNDRKRIKTEAAMKELRDGAQVELIGKFAEQIESPPVAAPILATGTSTVPAAGGRMDPSASALSSDVVRKGMSGLN